MTHTPGPWRAVREHDDGTKGERFDIEDAGPDLIADTSDSPHNLIVQEANARLIAAAPDLLDALKWAVQNYGIADQTPEHTKARAAVP